MLGPDSAYLQGFILGPKASNLGVQVQQEFETKHFGENSHFKMDAVAKPGKELVLTK